MTKAKDLKAGEQMSSPTYGVVATVNFDPTHQGDQVAVSLNVNGTDTTELLDPEQDVL